MRYVMRIAEFSESSNLWTQIALLGSPRSTPLSVSVQQSLSGVYKEACFRPIRVGWIMRVWVLVTQSLEIHGVKHMTSDQLCFIADSLHRLLIESDVNIGLYWSYFYVYLSNNIQVGVRRTIDRVKCLRRYTIWLYLHFMQYGLNFDLRWSETTPWI